jgi:hypothetical protein
MALFDRLSLRISQANDAIRSGAITQGSFPWERRQMSTKDINKEYGSVGLEVFNNYRKASEKGKGALRKVRNSSLDAFRSLTEDDCRKINKELESGKLKFDRVVEVLGERGVKGVQAYRAKHYYEPAEITGKGNREPLLTSIPQFKARQDRNGIHYFDKHQIGLSERAAFVDRGSKIEITEAKNKATVAAALELAANKWNGEFTVYGTEQYKELCVKIAAERNWKLSNPELQKSLEEAKAQLAARSQEAPAVGPAQETPLHVGPPSAEVSQQVQSVTPPAVEQPRPQPAAKTLSNKEHGDKTKPRVKAVLKQKTARSR